jgi:hypothetical protein
MAAGASLMTDISAGPSIHTVFRGRIPGTSAGKMTRTFQAVKVVFARAGLVFCGSCNEVIDNEGGCQGVPQSAVRFSRS